MNKKQKKRKAERLNEGRNIRSQRLAELRALKSGSIDLRDVLENPQRYAVAGCDIWDVLRNARHVGKTGAKKILLGAKVWPHDKLGDLGPAERSDVLKWLPARVV